MTDLQYMKHAMKLAMRAKGRTSPNPLVGAVIVKGGRIIGQGWHKYCGAEHAEITALKKAGKAARGAVLYVTLEPCFHFGRTPPCVDAVLQSGIRKVVIGMKDINPLTNGKSIARLRRAGVVVKTGVLGDELQKMNEAFIKYISRNVPFVVAKCAQTIDGKIATATGDSRWITAKKTREFARAIRNEFDAILVGVNTILKDNPGLNPAKSSKSLKKIILDSRLRTPLKAKFFEHTHPTDCILATTQKADRRKFDMFLHRGIEMIVCPLQNGRIDLKWLMKELAKQEITSILIEGGGEVVSNALECGLVDKMHVYIAPKIMGDDQAFSAVHGFSIKAIDQCLQLRDVRVAQLEQDIFIEGYVHGNR